MTQEPIPSTAALWACFRFSVVGPLLSAPPTRGHLKRAIRALAETTWTHPVTGQDVRYAVTTIERWYYTARNEPQDPVRVLQRAVRKDTGKMSVGVKLAARLRAQYRAHPHWSYQLHYDNMASAARRDPGLEPVRSYAAIRFPEHDEPSKQLFVLSRRVQYPKNAKRIIGRFVEAIGNFASPVCNAGQGGCHLDGSPIQGWWRAPQTRR